MNLERTGRLVLELIDPRDRRVEPIWRALEREAAPPYFLTWGWMSNWIACLPEADTPRLATLLTDGAPVAAFFLGSRRLVRHHVLPSRALFLNTTGIPRWDDLTLEHNAVLTHPSTRLSLTDLIAALPGDWDEVFFPALSTGTFPGSALGEVPQGHAIRIDREDPSYFVDLERVRGSSGGFLPLIGSGTRKQIRRSQRRFGDLKVEVATDLSHAMEIYHELTDLHARTWQARGLPGAFADPWFDGFHRRLIAERFAHGEIQLIRVSASGVTIGCLYSLISAGRVLFYQSGLGQFDDPNLMPGYTCITEAIQHSAAAGHAVFDFLGGSTLYKRRLATDEGRLVWARVQRPLARFGLEERLRRWKRTLRGWRSGMPEPGTEV